jgi:hypothetical protein
MPGKLKNTVKPVEFESAFATTQPDEYVADTDISNLTLNFGPQHPAAHGVLRLVR